jgi:YegS/Rv2252/BmrU family lipid kinase
VNLRFIVNPISGRRGRSRQVQALLAKFIAAERLDAPVVLTEGPGHATLLARTAVHEGCTRVVAVGGDGTMNEVAQGLVHTPAALALVPTGSGNGLARHLGLPLAPAAALRLAVDPAARITTIDTGLAGPRPFFNVMGLGLDADVSDRFNRQPSRGLPAYLRTALAAFSGRRTESCTIEIGAERVQIDLLWLAVANSDQYGNGAIIAPGAHSADGLLDLLAVQPVGWLGAVNLGARLFLGNLDRSSRVRRWRAPAFVVHRPAPGLIHTDGEPHPAEARVEIKVVPASLRLVACPAPP